MAMDWLLIASPGSRHETHHPARRAPRTRRAGRDQNPTSLQRVVIEDVKGRQKTFRFSSFPASCHALSAEPGDRALDTLRPFFPCLKFLKRFNIGRGEPGCRGFFGRGRLVLMAARRPVDHTPSCAFPKRFGRLIEAIYGQTPVISLDFNLRNPLKTIW